MRPSDRSDVSATALGLPTEVRIDAVARAILARNGIKDIPTHLARMRRSDWTTGFYHPDCSLCSFDVVVDGPTTLANAIINMPGGVDIHSAHHLHTTWWEPAIMFRGHILPESTLAAVRGRRLRDVVEHDGTADLGNLIVDSATNVELKQPRPILKLMIRPDWRTFPVGGEERSDR